MEMMKAVHIGSDKTPASLYLADVPRPEPAADEVLVKIAAAGVNRGDCLQRIGFYPPPKGAVDIMGMELSGRVVACGAQVENVKPGDRIAALVASGSYAEYATLHHTHLLPVPDSLSLVEAAALPEAIFTVWANIVEHGRFKSGETVLVHGGASGIGTMAIQMVRLLGGQVAVTAGTAEKCAGCLEMGAALAIHYRQEKFEDAVMEWTDGRGVDVILDMVGGDYVGRNIACAARHGRIVNIAYMQGADVQFNALPVMMRNLTLTGSTLRARSIAEKTRLTEEIMAHIWPHIGDKIRPVIDRILPLAEAGAAQALMEKSEHFGKIVLQLETGA